MDGIGFGPRIEMQAVEGRLRFLAREVNENWVSPMPWKRRRILAGMPVGGGTMSRVRLGGKSDLVGRRGGILGMCGIVDSPLT